MVLEIAWLSHKDIGNPDNGGSERTIYEVGKRLVGMGHSLTWFSVSWKGNSTIENIDGLNIIRFKSNFSAHFSIPFILRRNKFTVIVDDMGHAVPWGSELISNVPGTVFFRHLHRRSLPGQVSFPIAFLISSMEALYPFIYRHWSFVTESNSSVNDLLRLGIGKSRIVKIPPGVDHDRFTVSHKTTHPSIVYFGGFRDYKRPWDILYALKPLVCKYQDLTLTMIGTGPSLERVKSIASSLGLSDQVELTGRISEHDLAQRVSNSWINIHTSRTEGFGYSILEASAAGTPSIAYSVPGVRDVVEEGRNGYLVPDGCIDLLSRKLDSIIEAMSGDLQNQAREVATGYSWDKSAKLWEMHLTSVEDNARKDR